jgi:ActR/RegA family two-component response regulator
MVRARSVRTVLVVDDNESYLRTFVGWLRRRSDLDVKFATTLREALALVTQHRFDLAIVDFFIGTRWGTDVIRALRAADPAMAVVLFTANLTPALEQEALDAGAELAFDKCDFARIIPDVEAGASMAARDPARDRTAAQHEWNHLTEVLIECRNNRSETARQLGIPRYTLQRNFNNIPPPPPPQQREAARLARLVLGPDARTVSRPARTFGWGSHDRAKPVGVQIVDG